MNLAIKSGRNVFVKQRDKLVLNTGAAVMFLVDEPASTDAVMKRDAAARAPSLHLCHIFPIDGRAELTEPDVKLSPDRFTVKRTNNHDCA